MWDLAIITLAPMAIFGVVSWLLGISYRLSVLAGLVFIALTAGLLAFGLSGIADFSATLAYYFLLIGVVLAALEKFRPHGHKLARDQGDSADCSVSEAEKDTDMRA